MSRKVIDIDRSIRVVLNIQSAQFALIGFVVGGVVASVCQADPMSAGVGGVAICIAVLILGRIANSLLRTVAAQHWE